MNFEMKPCRNLAVTNVLTSSLLYRIVNRAQATAWVGTTENGCFRKIDMFVFQQVASKKMEIISKERQACKGKRHAIFTSKLMTGRCMANEDL